MTWLREGVNGEGQPEILHLLNFIAGLKSKKGHYYGFFPGIISKVLYTMLM